MKKFMKSLFCFLLVFMMAFGSIQVSAPTDTKAASGTYWLKVNKKANVVTVYQKSGGKWKPIKAMLCSCGGKNTTSGTHYTKAKYRWHTLMGPSYGQYCTRIVGGVLFHSVWYYNNGSRTSQAVKEFNKLGKTASHGCVRLSVEDSKWIYDHCSIGTKVTVYSSSKAGPLGKPAGYKMPSSAGSRNWDPTDASDSNKYYQGLPSLEKKTATVTFGDSKYDTAKALVTAKQKNGKAYKSLTITVKKKNSKKKFVSAKYSNKSTGTYKITYKLVGSSGVSLTKTFEFKVTKDTKAPVVKVSKTKDKLVLGSADATRWLASATMVDGTDRKSSSSVYVKAPGASKFVKMTFADAKKYVFDQKGDYEIYYVATNKNKTSVTGKSSTVTVTVAEKEVPPTTETPSTETPDTPSTETPPTTESTQAPTTATTAAPTTATTAAPATESTTAQ